MPSSNVALMETLLLEGAPSSNGRHLGRLWIAMLAVITVSLVLSPVPYRVAAAGQQAAESVQELAINRAFTPWKAPALSNRHGHAPPKPMLNGKPHTVTANGGRGPRLRQAALPTSAGMSSELAPFASLATLGAVVLIHELGHFWAARSQGIRVNEFSIGFGPSLFRRQGDDGINYTLRALPLGGYVSFPRYINRTQLIEQGLLFPDEELPGVEKVSTPDLLENRPGIEQAIVASAGVIANVVLTWTVFFSVATTIGIPMGARQPVVVRDVEQSSLADTAGFRPGDRVLSVGGVNFDATGKLLPVIGSSANPPAIDLAGQAIRAAVSKHTAFEAIVDRGGQTLTLSIPPVPVAVNTIGVLLQAPPDSGIIRVKSSALSASEYATQSVVTGSREAYNGLRSAVSALMQPSDATGNSAKFRGPLGIARMGSQLASADVTNLADFSAILSLNLAFFNALPLPGLDGWTLVLIAAEGAIRQKIPSTTKILANNLAYIILIAAFCRTTLSDMVEAGGTLKTAGAALSTGAEELGPPLLASLPALALIQLAQDRFAKNSTDAGRGRKN